MAKHGKRYDTAKASINPEGNYAPLDAFRLLSTFEVAKFDATVEAHFRLGVNVRHADEQLRGTIALPHVGATMHALCRPIQLPSATSKVVTNTLPTSCCTHSSKIAIRNRPNFSDGTVRSVTRLPSCL